MTMYETTERRLFMCLPQRLHLTQAFFREMEKRHVQLFCREDFREEMIIQKKSPRREELVYIFYREKIFYGSFFTEKVEVICREKKLEREDNFFRSCTMRKISCYEDSIGGKICKCLLQGSDLVKIFFRQKTLDRSTETRSLMGLS